MGQRPSAYLFFGFDIYDDQHGDLFPEMSAIADAFDTVDADDVWERVEKTLKEKYPLLRLIFHGSAEYPTIALAVKESVKETDWDDGAIPIDPFHLTHQRAVSMSQMRQFRADYGLPPLEPVWLLASHLG